MKFTKKQRERIFQVLNDYGIVLIDNDSKWDSIQVIDEDYFIEKLEEALNWTNAKDEGDIMKTYKITCHFKPLVYTIIAEDEAQAEFEAQKRIDEEVFICNDMEVDEYDEDN